MNDLPNLARELLPPPDPARLTPTDGAQHAPRILLLYGSLRDRSYSRFLTLEAERLLRYLGAETRVFDPRGLPLRCCNPLPDKSFQMAETSPLRCRMIEDTTIRNLSPATQQSYLYAVSKFSLHFGRAPDRLGVEDIRAYLVHLTAKGFAWSSVNQVACALRFFYGVTLGQATFVEKIPHAL